MKRILFGEQIEKFLKKNDFYNVVKDTITYEDKDYKGLEPKFYNTIRYVYAPTPFLKPSTPRIEFEVDEETDGFIGGYLYFNGDKGKNTDLKFFEDLEYFIKHMGE